MRKVILLLLAIIPLYADKLADQLQQEKMTTEIELERLKRAKIQEELFKIKNANERELQNKVAKEPYTHFPVLGKIIKLTDRSIAMPPVITLENATELVKRINFLNRKNNFPIFLVIDDCVGGDALGGELILKSIEHSKAKIYIVVRTYCASMCAIIVSTFAENAYVMSNAILLHHQISSHSEGNPTLQKERISFMLDLQNRLLAPVAKRRNQTVEQFVDSLYKISRTGDAVLFATEAVKENWIVNIIYGIEDGSFDSLTKKEDMPGIILFNKKQLEKKFPNSIFYMKFND